MENILSKNNDTALYKQLTNIVKQNILAGVYAENNKLPSEKELADLYNVSRITVRHAIECLAKENYVIKRQGKGTYVRPKEIDFYLNEYQGFYHNFLQNGLNPNTKLLFFGLKELPKDMRTSFKTKSKNKAFLQRLYLEGDKPIALASTWLPVALAKTPYSVVEETCSFELLSRYYKASIYRTEIILKMGKGEMETRKALEIKLDKSLFVASRRSFSSSGTVLECTTFSALAEDSEFIVTSPSRLDIIPSGG